MEIKKIIVQLYTVGTNLEKFILIKTCTLLKKRTKMMNYDSEIIACFNVKQAIISQLLKFITRRKFKIIVLLFLFQSKFAEKTVIRKSPYIISKKSEYEDQS